MDAQEESTAVTVSTSDNYVCKDCENAFRSKYSLNTHLITEHNKQPPELVKSINEVFSEFTILPEVGEEKDWSVFSESVQPDVERILSHAGTVKWNVSVNVSFIKLTKEMIRQESTFESGGKLHLIDSSNSHSEFADIGNRIENYLSMGSGWQLECIVELKLKYAVYRPLSGYSFVETPRHLALKKAIINIHNKDDKCFLWHILASLHPAKNNPHRVSHYVPYRNELDFTNITFPVKITDIGKFERMNKIGVSVFGYEKEVFPLRISQETNLKHHVDLLLLESQNKRHYCLIKNFDKLMSTTVTKHKGRLFFCRFCLQHFSSRARLNVHLEMCSQHKVQKVSMPSPTDIISFTNYKYMLPVPFTIYFDFECLVLPPTDNGSRPHEPCAYCFVVVNQDGRLFQNGIHTYRGTDPVTHFLTSVLSKANELADLLTRKISINMTQEDKENFLQAKICLLCEGPLGDDRVRDHCHFTGKYRGAVHAKCNLAFTKAKHIPVIAHNLSSYDAHLIMQKLGKFSLGVKCIPRTIEKYISFSVDLKNKISLRFLDSLQFLNASLDKCVQTVKNSNWTFPILKSQFEDISLLTRKGVFPYEYLDSLDKLTETHLPPLESFYSSLTLENITAEDYNHAQKVWRTFNITTLGDYLDLYVKSDVLLLAEVFQSFRKTCHDNFKLDPAHLFSTPGFSWQAFLKYTEVKLQPLTDIDMHLFIDSGMRGGIASVGNIRYAKANDPSNPKFDSSKPASSILYLDKNNLYGGALSEPMPKSNFRFLSREEIDRFDLNTHNPNMGYILRVDLDYPDYLHDSHNMYPMAPEKIPITQDMLSPISHRKHVNTTTKLVPNFRNKRNYVCHYRNLKFYIKHGLRLTRIHAVLEFKEEDYVRPYVNFNTEKRKKSKSDSERDFYKLCNNSLYGKTLENLRKRINVELTSKKRRAHRLINSPAFKSFKIFDNDLVAVSSHIKNLLLNKPIYIGFTVLELSKLFMYEFLYEKMLPVFGDRLNLLLTDTDSFVFHIKSPNALHEIKTKLSGEFDLSNFPPDHFAYSSENEGVVNKMKIEYPNNIISEVVALRPKMYSILFADSDQEIKVAKGVSRPLTKYRYRHSLYKETLESYREISDTVSRIHSSNHHIASINCKRITLSPFDDKRFYPDDKGIQSYAHYHYKACAQYSSGEQLT